MDQALRAAYKAALASPRDGTVRAAYARLLLRVGHGAAALHEATAAEALGATDMPSPPPIEDATGRWTLALWPPRRRARVPDGVAAPDVPDARWPMAVVRLVASTATVLGRRPGRGPALYVPRVLLPWPPACAGCEATPRREECEPCRGSGERFELTGWSEDRVPCDACSGTGRVSCSACAGRGVVLEEPGDDGAPCPHSFKAEHQAVLLPPSRRHLDLPGLRLATSAESEDADALLRCAACGLAALRLGSTTVPACGKCGFFAPAGCRCGVP